MIRSMTAFARNVAHGDWGVATWELRTVNHRYLEPSFRLPESLRSIEPALRELNAQYLTRGKLEANLRFQAGEAMPVNASVNIPMAKALITAGAEISTLLNDEQNLSTSDVMRWPGVILMQDELNETVSKHVLASYEAALQELVAVREREGRALVNVINERLTAIQQEVSAVQPLQEEIISAQQEKIRQRFAEVQLDVDQSRLEQELVFLAQKIDVTEELDRITTHVTEVQRILSKGGANGRRLDFLMQELNREANTLGSKSVHARTTKASVELKVYIEQMREQIQNIE